MNQITLTLSLEDQKVKKLLALLAENDTAVEVVSEAKEKQPKVIRKPKEKEVVSEVENVSETKISVAEEPVQVEPVQAVETQPKITKLEVRAAALRLSKNGKSEELKKIFEKFNAVNLSTLPESDYAAAIAEMEGVQI